MKIWKSDIKRKKGEVAHEIWTAEAIFDCLPWAAQQGAQEAVRMLIRKAEANQLYRSDEKVDMAVDILWNMFYCMGIDIQDTAKMMQSQK